jgi:ribosomal protein S18 acetylase RimI-like enzyme
MDAAYRTRTMTRDELASALDWAAQEGWNPGLHDAETFHAADPSGFLVGLLGDEPVASISIVKYGTSFAFLGLYIVRPAFRGRGLGWRLWQAAMASVPGRQVGLDGVVAQQANYRLSGFSPAWRNIRYEGEARAANATHLDIQPLADIPLADVLAYDAPFFPADRSAFLRAWLRQADASGKASMAHGRLQGYGLMRRCRAGWKIGPLFADDDAVADALFQALRSDAPPGEPIYLDIPEPNTAAVALTQRHGMRRVFETARMYTGPAPELPVRRMVGITSLELG